MSLLLQLVPGLVLLLAAGVPRWTAVAAAPAASAGVLGAAVTWTTLGGVAWGPLPVLVTLLPLGLLALLTRRVVQARLRSQPVPRAADPPGPAASRLGPAGRSVLTVASVVAAVGASWWVLLPGVPRPDALQQSHDAGFHVNALARVLATGDAGWYSVGATSSPSSATTFYPSGLHAHAALVAQLTGAHPVVVLNVVTLVLAAVVWPLGMVLAIRLLTGDLVATVAAVGLVPVTLVFPTLLLHFGVLWSNAAAVALAPGLLALMALLLDRRHRLVSRIGWLWSTGAAALGLGLVHPAGLLSVLLVVAPLVVTAGWSEGSQLLRRHPGGRRRALAVGAGAAAVLAVLLVLLARSRPVQGLLHNRTRSVTDTGQAVQEILTVGTHLTPGWLALALLALCGAVAGVRRGRGWLVVSALLVGACYVIAASVSGGWLAIVTALWDREPYRVAAPIAIPVLLLAATGAAALVRLGDRWIPVPGKRSGRWVVAVLVAALVLQGWPSATASARRLVGRNYGDQQWWRTVVSQREGRLYADVLGARPDGLGVIGDPFGGGQWAGVLGGHPGVITHFGGVWAGDRDLLRRHLREMSPAVCAAVQRLHVGYVVEDTDRVWDNDPRYPAFAGLRELSDVAGLERIGRDGTVSIYRITGCGAVR
ncbi:DUF6541 family protein [Arsenicicoccus sp. oral taxon 190]|uniref:DUF6541 family protein n=1 Tax=Arsenicicoccus sp. oral taxon 190 TaxID=1658671 RepID=UPI00067A09FD|nr:DUF6541 family protein [Arsenicicoccus sp. oral taxon 190]AKT51627.1 hypothetical protein ADJ73_10545 [Arsenicicoccus sp. oral taxon 190]